MTKAILEMSKNLVEAIERRTFQIEMTKNTLSAFLRRLDDWDRERKSPANGEFLQLSFCQKYFLNQTLPCIGSMCLHGIGKVTNCPIKSFGRS